MPIQMNVAEAKAKLSELIARAEAGEEVVIARDGAPVVRLAPVAQAGGQRLGFLAHLGAARFAPDAFAPDAEEAIAAEGGQV
jgi:prevent-host-death family protein